MISMKINNRLLGPEETEAALKNGLKFSFVFFFYREKKTMFSFPYKVNS